MFNLEIKLKFQHASKQMSEQTTFQAQHLHIYDLNDCIWEEYWNKEFYEDIWGVYANSCYELRNGSYTY